MRSWTIADRAQLPEPLAGRKPVRFEHQHWHRMGRAEGELEVGYDADDRPVRVEYHWLRYFSRANPALDDVYTAELWVRQPAGGWLYLVRPGADGFVPVTHEAVRTIFRQHLDLDAGD
jgi:hypothetical protein